MHKLEGIPDNELQTVLEDIEFEGLRLVSKYRATDGTWTIIVATASTADGDGGTPHEPQAPSGDTDGPPHTPPAEGMDSPDPIPPGPPDQFISARKIATKTILYVDTNGRDYVREGGSRAWRNFNPGNIRRGSFANANGAIGDDGAFAIFPDYKTGFNAIVTLLRANSYRNLSLVDAVFRYAPPSENNSAQYADFVEHHTGIDRNTILSTLPIADIRRIAKVIQQIEGWQEGQERSNSPAAVADAGANGGLSSAAASASEWMDIAKREAARPTGERTEWRDPGENPRILNYFKIGASWFDPVGGDEVDWCAAFVNFCLVTAGYIGTDHPGARSFFWNKKRQFTKLPGPAYGAVAVRRYAPFSDPRWETGAGHVGFVNSWTSNSVRLLGGNQSNTVKLQTFPLVRRNTAGTVTAEFVAFMMPVNN